MNCPVKGCEGKIEKDISFEGMIFNRKKKVTYYCPLCNFRNAKTFKVNEIEYQKKMEEQ